MSDCAQVAEDSDDDETSEGIVQSMFLRPEDDIQLTVRTKDDLDIFPLEINGSMDIDLNKTSATDLMM